MITFEYRAGGTRLEDFDVPEWIDEIIKNKVQQIADNWYYMLSTSLPFWAVRLAIVQGKLDCKDVAFLYDGHIIEINEYGAILEWPTGFADRESAYAEDILRLAMKKRKDSKNVPMGNE